jgi:hypothetical protein
MAGKISTIRAAISTAIEAVDLSAYSQGTGETALREALTLDVEASGFVTPHLVYYLEPQVMTPLDRNRGQVFTTASFKLTFIYRIRPNLDDVWADCDGAFDVAELVRSAVSADLGPATVRTDLITFLGTSQDGAMYAVELALTAIFNSDA